MEELEILDIKKTSINYYCTELDKLLEKGFAKADYSVVLGELKDDVNIKKAEINFMLFLNTEEFVDLDKSQNIDAKIELTYIMIFSTSNDLNEIDDKMIMVHIEPYIRKELFDFYSEIGLPTIPLPYRFWNHDKKK
ncbi:hypothetical protein [Sporosarcina limicola]|uniref:Uncharacterized protein n=1 Tax=Sporosarcina limicola TaxID=34101 RepID=A0A927MN65_9BACL|nr:hypothetical protein [Sporosarcina limicola]MBE1557091.1 hypothetical protein [Sporosarcina limicola]